MLLDKQCDQRTRHNNNNEKKKKICRPSLVWIQCSNVWNSHDIETYLKLITYPQHVPSNILEHIDLNFTLISHPKLGHFQLSRPLQFSFSFLFLALSYNYDSHQYRIVNSIIALASYSGKKSALACSHGHTLQIRLCHINVLANDELDLLSNLHFFSLKYRCRIFASLNTGYLRVMSKLVVFLQLH